MFLLDAVEYFPGCADGDIETGQAVVLLDRIGLRVGDAHMTGRVKRDDDPAGDRLGDSADDDGIENQRHQDGQQDSREGPAG